MTGFLLKNLVFIIPKAVNITFVFFLGTLAFSFSFSQKAVEWVNNSESNILNIVHCVAFLESIKCTCIK